MESGHSPPVCALNHLGHAALIYAVSQRVTRDLQLEETSHLRRTPFSKLDSKLESLLQRIEPMAGQSDRDVASAADLKRSWLSEWILAESKKGPKDLQELDGEEVLAALSTGEHCEEQRLLALQLCMGIELYRESSKGLREKDPGDGCRAAALTLGFDDSIVDAISRDNREFLSWLSRRKRLRYVAMGAAGALLVLSPFFLPFAALVGGLTGAGLSGAAKTSAGLALLGGGALADAGLGMAGGYCVLTVGSLTLGGGAGVSAGVLARTEDGPRMLAAGLAQVDGLVRYWAMRARIGNEYSRRRLDLLLERFLARKSELERLRLRSESESDRRSLLATTSLMDRCLQWFDQRGYWKVQTPSPPGAEGGEAISTPSPQSEPPTQRTHRD